MMDDLDGLAGDLAAFDGGDDAPAFEPELSDADREAGWSIKSRKAEPEPERSLDQEIETALDQAETGGADEVAEREWRRQVRKLADAALERHGVDPTRRHEVGLSRREAVRRALAGATRLADAPEAELPSLAKYYAGADPAKRLAVARGVLQAFGMETPESFGAAERAEYARLREVEQRLRSHLVETQQREQENTARNLEVVQRFAAENPDFSQLMPTVLGLAQAARAAGQGVDLPKLYAQARRAHGMPEPQQQAAKAADEQRRAKVANAKAATTPRTSSSRARAAEQAPSDKSIDALLNEGLDQLMGHLA